jgi:hypothetical protein
MSKTNKVLKEYNVKNGQYALEDGTPKPLTWLTKVALDADFGEQPIYGDGEEVLVLQNDKGYTGSITLTAPDAEFEKDLGILEELDNGVAHVQRMSNPKVSIYFEAYYIGSDGITKTKKVWLFGVNVSKPSMPLEQSTDNPNFSDTEYAITVRGVNKKDSDGIEDYVDTNGNTQKVYRLASVPTDGGYSTFGNTVPVPKVKAPVVES